MADRMNWGRLIGAACAVALFCGAPLQSQAAVRTRQQHHPRRTSKAAKRRALMRAIHEESLRPLEFELPQAAQLTPTPEEPILGYLLPAPKTLADLQAQVHDGARSLAGECAIRSRDGQYTAAASALIDQVEGPGGRLWPQVSYQTDLQVFDANGQLADQILGFDRGQSLIPVPACASLDWIYLTTFLDGDYLFELAQGGKLLMTLHERDSTGGPVLNVMDLHEAGSFAILIPAASSGIATAYRWEYLTTDGRHQGYAWNSELRANVSDELTDLGTGDFSAGVFVLRYPHVPDPQAGELLHDASLEYWSPELLQWNLLTKDLRATIRSSQAEQSRPEGQVSQ